MGSILTRGNELLVCGIQRDADLLLFLFYTINGNGVSCISRVVFLLFILLVSRTQQDRQREPSWNLVLKQSVPYFLPNSGDIAC